MDLDELQGLSKALLHGGDTICILRKYLKKDAIQSKSELALDHLKLRSAAPS
eukprot:m.843 g.843  ORF g.843 m.843 type:complete len:52 (-) comp1356_c0_seq1:31-186(-)